GDAERINIFDVVVKHIADRRASGAKVLVTAWTEGSLERLLQVLNEHVLEKVKPIEALKDVGSPMTTRSPASKPASRLSTAAAASP
ncbi:hypothetical protein ACC758_38835, partial [Rhizobium ruizarguesonis]